MLRCGSGFFWYGRLDSEETQTWVQLIFQVGDLKVEARPERKSRDRNNKKQTHKIRSHVGFRQGTRLFPDISPLVVPCTAHLMSGKWVVMFAAPAVSAYMLLYGPDGPPPPSPKPSVLDSACYNDTWPVVSNCVKWWTNGTHRYVEGNSIPDHDEHGNRDATLGPYCPFGKDDPRGYCLPAEGDQCPFKDLICPAQESAKSLELDGDVPVSFQIWAEFPLNPDPTADDLPKHLYSGATQYQQIGVHLNGVHIKGPGEAEGYNVDTSRIPLLCGGHVTPPIGAGPVYHYHKASTCDHIEVVGQHGPLIGFANDGFAIYGFQDIDGTAPVVDECNGHFGPVSNEKARRSDLPLPRARDKRGALFDL